MIKDLLEKIEKVNEAKDTDTDYNKSFQVAVIPNEKAVVIKQLFNYETKYPIYIKVEDKDEEIANKIAQIKNYDIDISDVNVDLSNNNASLILIVNIDSNELDDVLNFKIVLNGDNKDIFKL